VKLYLEPADPPHVYTFTYPDQSVGTLPGLRLVAFTDLRQHITDRAHLPHAIQKCVVDTGSLLSVVPSLIARRLDMRTVTRLPFHPSFPPRFRVLTMGGLSVPYELAELRARLRDKDGQVIDARFVAMFTRDNGALGRSLILGLRGGVIDGRTLRGEPDPVAPFGQGWQLDGS
jgi:hypothetical protein